MNQKLQTYTPTAKLSKSAIALLRKVKQKVLRYPEKVDMNDWLQSNRCGTTACIGGWCCILAHGGMRNTPKMYAKINDFEGEATRLLGFGYSEELFADLFTPKGFRASIGTYAYTGEVADRIDAFIAQHS